MDFERRSLELTPNQWQALDRLAASLGALAPTGPTAGQPSWRTLIRHIADAGLEVRPLTCAAETEGDMRRYLVVVEGGQNGKNYAARKQSG